MPTKRWDRKTNDYIKNQHVDEFLQAILEVCKQHKLSLSHEDDNGAFIVENYKQPNIDWLNEAMINIEKEKT